MAQIDIRASLGFCIPYIVNMTSEIGVQETFIYNHPSIFTVAIVVIIFELNRYIVKTYKGVLSSVHKQILYRVLFKFAFQLVFTFCLLFLFLSIWYGAILKMEDYHELIFMNISFGLVITLIFLLFYELSYFFYKWTEEQSRVKNLEIIFKAFLDVVKFLKFIRYNN